MRAKLIPIKYNEYQYKILTPKIMEVAAHFDINKINPKMDYSLHTEYSFRERKYEDIIFKDLYILKDSNYKGIPLLWFNKEWGEQFFYFIKNLTKEQKIPKIIEIHPPFKDYCNNFDVFFERYNKFEKLIYKHFHDTIILIENRYGSFYNLSNFLLSSIDDIGIFIKKLKMKDLNLKIVLDIPQLIEVEGGPNKYTLNKIINFMAENKQNISLILGLHIWGNSGRPHVGDLDSLFNNDKKLKRYFLYSISNILNDNIPRYFLPEVNFSNQKDFESIIRDISEYFEFV